MTCLLPTPPHLRYIAAQYGAHKYNTLRLRGLPPYTLWTGFRSLQCFVIEQPAGLFKTHHGNHPLGP
jgi:hypothetical protein